MNHRGPNRRTQTAAKETTTKVTRPSRCCVDGDHAQRRADRGRDGHAGHRAQRRRPGRLADQVATSMATIAPISTARVGGTPSDAGVHQLHQHRRADGEHRLQRLPEPARGRGRGDQPVASVLDGGPSPRRARLGQPPNAPARVMGCMGADPSRQAMVGLRAAPDAPVPGHLRDQLDRRRAERLTDSAVARGPQR